MRISDWSSDVCSSDLVEAELRGDAHRVMVKAAGNQRAIDAMLFQRVDQRGGAGHQLDLLGHPVEQAGRLALQQADALAERLVEIEFAVHRAPGDLGDL